MGEGETERFEEGTERKEHVSRKEYTHKIRASSSELRQQLRIVGKSKSKLEKSMEMYETEPGPNSMPYLSDCKRQWL